MPTAWLSYTACVSFWVHRSNRVERLAGELRRVLATPLENPLAPECIVVQGPGMERWLSQTLAKAIGVWANPWFPFPRTVIELILEASLGPPSEGAEHFELRHLRFAIARELPGLLHDDAFASVDHYLSGDRDGDRLISVSSQLASVFDQYLVYRPELILGWEQGDSEHFQAKLWRTLARGRQNTHLAQRLHALEQKLKLGPVDTLQQLPRRISLFGLSSLPPAFLRVLQHAASDSDVHVFLLSPTRAYMGELDKAQRYGDDVASLLANLGKVHRDFVDLLEELPYQERDEDLFVVPPADSVLHGLQADLAQLCCRGEAPAALPPLTLTPEDHSVRVHCCHSPLRELEVLRDELTERLERDPSLAPHDIVVLAPDIDRYAPAIEAVFSDLDARQGLPLPFHVADRRAAHGAPVPAAFISLLSLIQSRLGLSQVIDVLQRAPIRLRFDVTEDELARATSWLTDAGARWAIDGAHRTRFGQPNYEEHSLRFALDRLLLGYASADSEAAPFFDRLPHPEVEGQGAEVLGRVCRFFERLFSAVDGLRAARSIDGWAHDLCALLESMVSSADAFALEHRMLAALMTELGDASSQVGLDAPVSLAVMQALIEAELRKRSMGETLLSRGITFCEHVPMRAIPFRVVCLLGLDDESFPRTSERSPFDLMSERPRRGDRSPREDDRQLFLETLLSARDAWLVTYVGRSAKDDSIRPKAAVVDHVLRVLDQHFTAADQSGTLQLRFETTSELLLREHSLHGFDARYFAVEPRSPWFSYNQSAFQAAQAQRVETKAPTAFAGEPLPEEDAHGEDALELESLLRFFRHPQRAFIQRRLSLFLPRELDLANDREPTELNALERYQLADELLGPLGECDPADQYRTLRLTGRLPPGSLGRVQWQQMAAIMEEVRSVGEPGERLPDRSLSLACGARRLVGKLSFVFERARVERIASKPSTKHQLAAWIRHLALCASGEAPQRSLLVGRDARAAVVYEFARVAQPLEHLHALVALYELGQRTPLPYFHSLSDAYVRQHRKSGHEDEALRAAHRAALKNTGPGQGPPPDLEDAYVRQSWAREELEHAHLLMACAGDTTRSFAEIARQVLGPMHEHMRLSKD